MTWTPEQLTELDAPDEIGVSSRRRDGSLRPFVTIWAVRAGDHFYIRSARGAEGAWYRHALASGEGQIKVGGSTYDVAFVHLTADDPAQADIEVAYHAKYDRYGARIVGSVTGPAAAQVSLRLDPVEEASR